MHTPQNIEEKLWNYIDGTLDKKDLDIIEELLRNNNEWKSKYAELLEVNAIMKSSIDLEQPSLRFTQNVMEEISRLYITPATRNYINKNVIWGIGIFFLTTIVSLLGYGIGQVDWSQPGTRNVTQLQEINNAWSQVLSGPYINVFIMINILLGLMLLDMYLTRKKNERIQQRQA